MGFRIQGSGFRVLGLGFRVQGLGEVLGFWGIQPKTRKTELLLLSFALVPVPSRVQRREGKRRMRMPHLKAERLEGSRGGRVVGEVPL